jgi:hypothetical protein
MLLPNALFSRPHPRTHPLRFRDGRNLHGISNLHCRFVFAIRCICGGCYYLFEESGWDDFTVCGTATFWEIGGGMGCDGFGVDCCGYDAIAGVV